MYSREQLIEFHEAAREIKEHWWYHHNEPDPPPLLSVRYRDHEREVVDFNVIGHAVRAFHDVSVKFNIGSWQDEGVTRTPFVLFTALSALRDGVPLPGMTHAPPDTPLESIWFAVEGYSLTLKDCEDDEIPHHGEMEQDYKTNPASKVRERLTTYMVETSSTGLAEWARITSEFHKDDGGRVVWGEPLIETSEDERPPELGDAVADDSLLTVMIPHVTRENLT